MVTPIGANQAEIHVAPRQFRKINLVRPSVRRDDILLEYEDVEEPPVCGVLRHIALRNSADNREFLLHTQYEDAFHTLNIISFFQSVGQSIVTANRLPIRECSRRYRIGASAQIRRDVINGDEDREGMSHRLVLGKELLRCFLLAITIG